MKADDVADCLAAVATIAGGVAAAVWTSDADYALIACLAVMVGCGHICGAVAGFTVKAIAKRLHRNSAN